MEYSLLKLWKYQEFVMKVSFLTWMLETRSIWITKTYSVPCLCKYIKVIVDFPGAAVISIRLCQCWGHRFGPWSGKIPHARSFRSSRAHELQLLNNAFCPRAHSGARSHCSEKAHAALTKHSPHSLRSGKSSERNEDPAYFKTGFF